MDGPAGLFLQDEGFISSIERQIMDGPAGLFLQDEGFISHMLTYVPCQTSIPYSKNGLMRE